MALASPSIWTLLVLAVMAAAQEVAPSNTTDHLPTSDTQRIALTVRSTDMRDPGVSVDVIPLTVNAGLPYLPEHGIQGFLRITDATSANNITSNDIAYISCDPSSYPGNINAASVLERVVDRNATGALLYSNTSSYCNFTAGPNINPGYPYIYSMIDTKRSVGVLRQLGMNAVMALIEPQSTLDRTSNSTNPSSNGNNGNQNNNGNNGNNNGGGGNPWGPSPSTAVAMIILYSITGVITALFLVIIITGAIRAHRHPERYGPRNVLGRPRQSRAKGLARAMLDTIPIVKFGERESDKPADVELGAANAAPAGAEAENNAERRTSITGAATDNQAAQTSHGDNTDITPVAATAAAAGPSDEPHRDEGLGCSICTEDFERGQDIRVLPCNHKFHPACIDPWLLNVSGTCPLCRIDLRPTTSHTSDAGTTSSSRRASFAPPLEEADAAAPASNRRSRRMSAFFDVLNRRRMADAPMEERIAALRRLRAEQPAPQGEDEAETRRRRRLTVVLQDVFHVRTRREGNADGGGGGGGGSGNEEAGRQPSSAG